MNPGTLIRKETSISGRIMNPSDLRQLSDVIVEQFDNDHTDEEYAEFSKEYAGKPLDKVSESLKVYAKQAFDSRIRKSYVLTDADKTTYENDDQGILRIGGLLDTKRIISVRMDFENRIKGNSIQINIKHSADSPSKAEVSGYDETWTSGTMERVKNVVSGCKRQYAFPIWHRIGLMIAIVVLGSWLVHNIVYLGAHALYSTVDWNSKANANAYLFPGIAMTMLSVFLVDKVSGLFPTMELITGPPHSRTEERRRNAWWLLAILVGLPLVLGIVTNILMEI